MAALVDRFDFFVFDFDGTLIKSQSIGREISRKLMAAHGVPGYSRDDFEKEIGGLPVPEYMQWLIDRFDLRDVTKEQLNAEHLEFYKQLLPGAQLVEGAPEYLALLKAHGKKIGIATACDMDIMDAALAANPAIRSIVDCVMTCTIAGKNKPDCAVYVECLKRLGGSLERAVVFEDSIPGLQGARASGMYVVGIITDRQYFEEKVGLCDEWYENFVGLPNE